MIKIREIDHIVLRAKDPQKMLAFYRDVLGCELEKTQERFGLFQLRAGNSIIDIIDVDGQIGREGGAPPGREGRNLDHFCVRIDPFDEQSVHAHLAKFGLSCEPAATRYGAEGSGPSIYLKDPENNIVELKGPPAIG